MLHAVAAAPRHVVAEERVGAGLELRELAEDAAFLADDLLDARAVLVDVGVGRVVMDCGPDGRAPCRRDCVTVNVRIDCALSSVGLSIRYWRLGAVNVQGSSVGKSCVAASSARSCRRLEA